MGGFWKRVLMLSFAALLLTQAAMMAAAKPKYQDRTSFQENYSPTWAPDHVNLLDGGSEIQLQLDERSGSAFASNQSFLFGYFSMQLKLASGNSAGTVTAFYLSSEGEGGDHDEVDLEFLGNVASQSYILQSNVFAGGVGGREERTRLWFDPAQDFHTYAISWNPRQITFLVDSYPIRILENQELRGAGYPHRQPMKVLCSLWDGSSWATQGGNVKIDWSSAPFTVSYRSFGLSSTCPASSNHDCAQMAAGSWWGQGMYIQNPPGGNKGKKLRRVRKHFLLYDYCNDKARYPRLPPECETY